MPTFDVVVLGCGGGPSEYNLSSYLLKPHDGSWHEGIIGLDAGSGIGALAQLLQKQPDLFGIRSMNGDGSVSKPYTAAEIYSWLRCYLITHAHLDHLNGAVLTAGALSGPPRQIYSTMQVLKDIETIFSDRLWPNLTSWDEHDQRPLVALLYSELIPNGQYRSIFKDISVRTMLLSHGCYPGTTAVYDSTAFFLRHIPSGRELLFFGDVEPDSIAGTGRTQAVWDVAAPMIPHALSTIFIECSWPLGRPADTLYGHLSPEYLTAELTNLATAIWKAREAADGEVRGASPTSPVRKRQKRNHLNPASSMLEQSRGMLEGVKIVVIHCKEDLRGEFDRPINEVIADQVRLLVDEKGLGAEIVAAAQGMQIAV